MIDLQPDEQQQIIVDSVTNFLAEELPVSRLNPKEDKGNMELQLWSKMAELGWFQLLLPEELEGFGLGNAECALIGQAFGRYLLSPSVAGTIIAARLAAEAGLQDLAMELANGRCRAALACPADWPDNVPDTPTDTLIIDGSDATLLVCFTGQEIQLRECASVTRTVLTCFDNTLPLEGIRRDQSRLLYCGAKDSTSAIQLTLFLAAMLAGNAGATRDMSVDYALVRQQFGKPIGAFQAIKHMCADLAIRAESASAMALFAAVNTDLKGVGAAEDAASALIVSARAAITNAETNIQIHGGFGFTAECSAHNYLKRAILIEKLSGSVSLHQDLLLTLGDSCNAA